MKTNDFKLFLDDIRKPKDGFLYNDGRYLLDASNTANSSWDVVRNYEDFCEWIDKFGVPSVVSFDHDLSFEFMKHYHEFTKHTGIVDYDNLKSKCGLDCVKFLLDVCLKSNIKFPTYYIHSANRWGSENMRKCIEIFLNKYPHLKG
jgi:hypothetical protein